LAFLLRRFDRAGAYGISFTITLAALFLGIWFFGSALEDILAVNGTALFDAPVADFIALHRVAWLTTVMNGVSFVGGIGILVVVAVIAAISVYRARGWRPLIFFVGVIVGAEILDLAIGLLVARLRPAVALTAVSAVISDFPTGLTTVSTLYGIVAYFIAASRSAWQSKVFIWSSAILVIFLVGVSRIYLGTDWLSDVVSRWALALLWLSASLVMMRVIEQPSGAAVTPQAGLSPAVPTFEGTAPDIPSIAVASRREVSIDGLSGSEVLERQSRGDVNIVKERTSRSVASILKANIFTRFNALLGGLFVVILLISGKQDALFGLILIANTVIGVVQELRAKSTLDHLRVLVAPRAHVVRGGVARDVLVDQIVLDDVLELCPGDQVPVDGLLLTAQDLEINESLLTGEADPVPKSCGDQALSGSFVVAGSGRLQAVQIGEAAYASRLARAARQFSLSPSQLRNGINNILRYVTWALIPTASVLFITQLLYSPAGAHDAAVSSIAGVVGMVPSGLVLLTSTVMAVAVVRLAGLGALVQELAAVEMLARVDIILTDKTGTLTEGALTLEEIVPVTAEASSSRAPIPVDVQNVLGAFAHDEASAISSSIALRSACPKPAGSGWNVVAAVPFSSIRKWSALTFTNGSSWILGAPEIVLKNADRGAQLLTSVDELARKGKRVLALVSSEQRPGVATGPAALPTHVKPAALVVLGERIRSDVAETIRYFEEQGVTVKVVSGDHAETVQSVAALAGLPSIQRAIDARSLPADPAEFGKIIDQNSLFGRVAPAQKRLMVKALHDQGHVVAMIGDGINDVLAIKEADFGIALASGTAASRAVAQLILLKNSFSVLPAVIAEGRRVIANVERTANLFITKTVYVFALAVAIGIAQAPFPFLPRHLTLVNFLTIGTPGLFLSFARNTTVARPGFVGRVLRFAFRPGPLLPLPRFSVTQQRECSCPTMSTWRGRPRLWCWLDADSLSYGYLPDRGASGRGSFCRLYRLCLSSS
jgi:cation-transporting ATPase E